MNVPDEERSFFYAHMGHSEVINKNMYQSPLALMETIKVGKSLHIIDGGIDVVDSEKSESQTSHKIASSMRKYNKWSKIMRIC